MCDSALLQRFVKSIVQQTGLYVRPQDERGLLAKIQARMESIGISSLEDYYQLLSASFNGASSQQKARSHQEWQKLIQRLVVTESYFFRDRGQFELLRSRILPELIVKNRNLAARANCPKPRFKVWSAACASGEEPYSIAILLRELLPDLQDWDLSIVGTDINHEVLDRAKRGHYNTWSFRQVEPHLQQQYFRRDGDRYHIDARVQEMVQFQPLNLVGHDFPNPEIDLHEIDLILCRNVFIYFDRRSIDLVLQKFYQTLAQGGYLIAAHAELQGRSIQPFHVQLFPQSVVYQRCDLPELDSVSPTSDRAFIFERTSSGDSTDPTLSSSRIDTFDRSSALPLANPSRTIQSSSQLKQPSPQSSCRSDASPSNGGRTLFNATESANASLDRDFDRSWNDALHDFQQKNYPEAIQHAECVLSQQIRHLDAHTLIARAYANLGDYRKATYYCMQALEIESLAVVPYYLLATISELQGNPSRAKNFLKKIVYIDPHAPLAYLELAQIYYAEGDLHRARKMQNTAIEILKTLPATSFVDLDGQLTAGGLLEQVQQSSIAG
ncbi:MAG: hypothetical protein J7641_11350 [Cyanobacteria bacterium SID2]|nr:hypothetical protein [Cyanobacteria bacterium SID2]MBP0002324.1 hypothetical protein [Cyanobacteria bacterium SBC]